MNENISNFESLGMSVNDKTKVSYKPHLFSMRDDVRDIRSLVIQMAHVPLHKEKTNDNQR